MSAYTGQQGMAYQSVTGTPISADTSGVIDCTQQINSGKLPPMALLFPTGLYKIGTGMAPGGYAILFDNSGNTTNTTPQGRFFNGNGPRLSILNNVTAGLWSIGVFGTLVAPFAVNGELYNSFGQIAFSTSVGAYGLFITGCTFFCLKDCDFYQMAKAIQIDQCVSCEFDNITARWGQYGIITTGGAVSEVNAVLFKSCRIGNNSLLGFSGNNGSSNITFIGCNFEGNGTQGNNATGGVSVNFDGGTQGAVGYNFIGCYFEGNLGQADIVLNNTGATPVTVNITGCNFNRASPTNFVQHNIVTIGPIYLVLTSCSFKGFNGYTPNASNTYVHANDANLTVRCLGCLFDSALEQGTLVNL